MCGVGELNFHFHQAMGGWTDWYHAPYQICIYDNRDGAYISEVCKYVLCMIGPLRLVKTFFSEFVEVKEVVPTLRSQFFLLEICIYWGTIFYFLENNPSGNNAMHIHSSRCTENFHVWPVFGFTSDI